MHTQNEFIPGYIRAAQAITKHRANFFDQQPISSQEIIEYITANPSILGFELDEEDNSPVPGSDSISLRWQRRIYNLNSNVKLKNEGLVTAAPASKYHGLMFTDRAMTITDVELDNIAGRITVASEKKETNILKKHIDILYSGTKAAEPTESKKLTHKTAGTYYAAEPETYAAVVERSNTCCESCGEQFEPKETGGWICQVHHIFDVNADDEDVMPNKRLNSADHKAALCGTCHQIFHEGIDSHEQSRALLFKIQKINRLIHVDAPTEEIDIIKNEKIIKKRKN